MRKIIVSGWGGYLLLLLVVFAAYGGALNNSYVWDDRYFLVDYVLIDTVKDAWHASFQPLFGQRSYVRPLPLLTLYLEGVLTGRNPAISHAVNLLLHLAASFFVYRIALRAVGDKAVKDKSWLPLVVACLFAAHPALSENVIWVSSRFDLLATFFVLTAVYVAGLKLSDWSRAGAVALLFFLGLVSKESAAVLPAILGVLALMQGAQARPDATVRLIDAFSARQIKLYAGLLVCGLLYLVIRRAVLSGQGLYQYSPIGLDEHLVRFSLSLCKYAQLTLMPFVGNSPHHSFMWEADSSLMMYLPQVIAAVGMLLLSAVLVLRGAKVGWWILLWIACYLPVLHFVPLTIGSNLVHQRFMYLPTAILLGFAPYVSQRIMLSNLGKRAALALASVLVVVSILVCRTIVPVWRDDLTLWRWTVAMAPDSVEARENLIWSYLDVGMFEEAKKELAYIRNAGMKTTANVAVNMGVAHYRRSEFEEAERYYDIAAAHLGLLPPAQISRLYSNMAFNYALLGRSDEAKEMITKSLEVDPRNATALSGLMAFCLGDVPGLTRYRVDDLDRARRRAESAAAVIDRFQSSLRTSGRLCPSTSVDD